MPEAGGQTPGPGGPYDADPAHLWNRLHEALLVRIGPDGHAYGRDRLEPYLWPQTKHLLEPDSCDRAVRLLDEFLDKKGERRIDDPVKRAVLQRDLWLVFNWVEGEHGNFENPPLEEATWRTAQKRLRRRLAAVIGRLAQGPDALRSLPDNYAAAVASGRFARRFDPEHPDRPYLPPDLFATDGPWVCLGRPDGPVTPEHLREDGGNPFTSSAFLVFLRLPDGRAATLAYLKRLRAFNEPVLVRAEDGERRSQPFLPNPRLPAFPPGTEVALVRRALLVTIPPAPVPSALTESVQVRVYREVPDMTAQTLDAALGGGTAANRRARAWQSFQEFRLNRGLLFAGRAGGLHAVGPDEHDFDTGFGAHAFDEFEAHFTGQSFTGPRFAVTENCFACHSFPGAYSFNSFFNYRGSNLREGDTGRPASLSEVSSAEAAEAAARWKAGRASWASLRDLLAK
jgi:hypothetical protein